MFRPLDVAELQSLEIYFATYLVFWFALAIWFLPMFATTLLPLKYREIMGPARDALITAFATGSVFVVLPLLADYWILGKSVRPTPPRWCVIRDVLHWVD